LVSIVFKVFIDETILTIAINVLSTKDNELSAVRMELAIRIEGL